MSIHSNVAVAWYLFVSTVRQSLSTSRMQIPELKLQGWGGLECWGVGSFRVATGPLVVSSRFDYLGFFGKTTRRFQNTTKTTFSSTI